MRAEWNWMDSCFFSRFLVDSLLNTHVYHILRTCDVCMSFTKWSAINFKSPIFIEQSISCVMAHGVGLATHRGQRITRLYFVVYRILPSAPYINPTRTSCVPLAQIPLKHTRTRIKRGIFRFWHQYRAKYLLQLTQKNPSCAPLPPNSVWRVVEISSIYFYFASSREIHFSIIIKNVQRYMDELRR